jgi:NAD(P)-dependent dehydrogenase (short-subunit alcohol dehydrogenase family)
VRVKPQTDLHKLEEEMPPDLKGKRIIVTGAATGIGRATALRVSAYGARVAAFDVNDPEGISTVNDINEAAGDARYWHVDVVDDAQVSGGVSAAAQWLGGVDVLLHFAGVLQGANVELDEFPEATWDSVVDINLKGSFLIAKHVAGVMKKQKRGVIILTASGAGVTGGSSSYAYGSSKGGVHGLALVMQGYLGKHGIRVNDVAPGAVDTPLKVGQVKHTYSVTGDKEAYEKAMASLVSPDGVAKVYAWLASDEAEYVRGTVFTR